MNVNYPDLFSALAPWLIAAAYLATGCAFAMVAIHRWGAELAEPRERRAVVALWPLFVVIAVVAAIAERITRPAGK